MKLTRTRLLIAAIVPLLAISMAACASAGGSKNETADGPGAPGDATGGDANTLSLPGDGERSGAGAPANGSTDGAGDTQKGTDPALQGLLDRKIVQNATVDVNVKEVGRSFQDIINLAQVNGGYVASSSLSNVDETQVADITIRVPAERYQSVLAAVGQMGDVVTQGSDSSDVTEEFTDLQARLRTLEATEQRYLELLGQATNVNDILTVQDRLDVVRGEIEQVQGRINVVNNLTDLATITIHVRPVAVAATNGSGGGIHPLTAAQHAWDASLNTLRGLAAVALVAAVFSWWLVPPLAAAGLGTRWWRGRRPRSSPAT